MEVRGRPSDQLRLDKVRYISRRRIRVRPKVLSIEPRSGGRQVKKECTVEIEGETKPACVAETLTLYFAS